MSIGMMCDDGDGDDDTVSVMVMMMIPDPSCNLPLLRASLQAAPSIGL